MAKENRITWLAGNKEQGVGVYKLNYKTPQWRFAVWNKRRLFRIADFNTFKAAMGEAS